MRIFWRAIIPVSLTCLAFLLSGCNDEAKLAAAVQLGNNGKAAARAYVEYVDSTASIFAKQCDLENFQDMLLYREKQMDVSAERQDMTQCALDPNRQRTISELHTWAQDGVALGMVYSSLANLAGPTGSINVDTAVNSLASTVASASKLHVSSGVSKALDGLSTAIIDHKTAKGVEKFAQAMGSVPNELASVLSSPAVASAFDGIYSVYDTDLSNAIDAAYSNNMVNPEPELEKFFATLGVSMPSNLGTDPYVLAFARTLGQKSLYPAGKEEREKIIGLLQNLAKETSQLESLNGQGSSIRDQIAEIRALHSKVNKIAGLSNQDK